MFWRCPQWETLRGEKQAPSIHDRLAWPPCTSRCAIHFEDPEAVAWAGGGTSEQALFERENRHDENVVAWTDGTCVRNHDGSLLQCR